MIDLQVFERSPRLAELKVSYKRSRKISNEPEPSARIASSKSAEEYFRAIWSAGTLELIEEFVLVCLNGAHHPIGWIRISTGGFNATHVDPRVIFSVALQTAACAIIVAHNHPSGNLTPSSHDIATTKRLKQAGEFLEMPLLDHIILSRQSAFSFAENGLL